MVHVYEASEGKSLYKKERELSVPNTTNGQQCVKNVTVSPSEDHVLCATDQNQLYTLALNEIDRADDTSEV